MVEFLRVLVGFGRKRLGCMYGGPFQPFFPINVILRSFPREESCFDGLAPALSLPLFPPVDDDLAVSARISSKRTFHSGSDG